MEIRIVIILLQIQNIHKKVTDLTTYCIQELSKLPGITFTPGVAYNKKSQNTGIISFKIEYELEQIIEVLDHENNSGWIHISQLSKKKAALSILDELIVFQKPSIYSKPLVKLEIGRLCLVKTCKNNWCKIKTGGYTGWVEKQNLRGRL